MTLPVPAPLSLPVVVDFDPRLVGDALANAVDEIDQSLGQAMDEATIVVADAARTTTTFTDRTHALRSSIQPDDPPVSGTFFAGDLTGTVGFGATSEGFPYGLALEFGSRAHRIEARRRKALRFGNASAGRFEAGTALSAFVNEGAGAWIFRRAVVHPGTRPLHFMADALSSSDGEIGGIFERALQDAAYRAGLV